ncbi:hypothetical protein LCGC14_2033840 [marine sediment metagenome]|uniref:Uncharacterized protein n=1 Tax=marine sediment metagenome TaxID=412755 RepID=A0A0F9H7D2_9ZZZZ
MGDKEALQGLVKKIKTAIPRNRNQEPETPPAILDDIGATFERELEIQRIGASAVAEVEERERQEGE